MQVRKPLPCAFEGITKSFGGLHWSTACFNEACAHIGELKWHSGDPGTQGAYSFLHNEGIAEELPQRRFTVAIKLFILLFREKPSQCE